MKKTEGRKSRATVPLRRNIRTPQDVRKYLHYSMQTHLSCRFELQTQIILNIHLGKFRETDDYFDYKIFFVIIYFVNYVIRFVFNIY
jgi:hypothetical protein